MPGKILVIDDEDSIRFTFQRHLEKEGYMVTTAADYTSALHQIAEKSYELVFADILLPDNHSGIELLRIITQRRLNCPVIMITGAPNIETAAESVRLGAYDYLPKPVEKSALLRVTTQALRHKLLQDEKARVEAENTQYRQHLDAIFRSVFEGIITVNPEMQVMNVNHAAIQFFQLDPQQVVGRKLDDLLDEGYATCCTVVQDTLQSHTSVREYRVELCPTNRAQQVVMLNSSPLVDQEQKFLGAVLVIRDITCLTNLERELKERHRFQNIIGKSPQLQAIYNLLEDLTETKTTVLITGESGTGKELVAEALHYNSPGTVKPLIKVNCSALAESLLESELFGHVKGAFTGAIKEKVGRFQMANGGTIFLDEIGDITPHIQRKLLRVLQEKTFERVGDATPMKVDLRVIAATNCRLVEKVQQGEFREDLYYRFKVVEIELPPLRERREDLPLLVNHFCERFNQSFKKQIQGVSDEALALFMDYAWPGNVRELEHALEHAFVICHGDVIACEHLPREIRDFSGLQATIGSVEQTSVNSDEAENLRQALQKTGWNKAKASRLLGMDRRTIYRKMKKYQITEQNM